MCAVPAAQVLQEALGLGMLRERDLLHEVVLRETLEDLLLQGLPHGARAEDLLLQGLPYGARATQPHGVLQGLPYGARAEIVLLQGLPHGTRAAQPHGVLEDLQD